MEEDGVQAVETLDVEKVVQVMVIVEIVEVEVEVDVS